MRGKKRERLQVIFDILKTIQDKNGKAGPTHILYKSNLSHQMMDEYLKDLEHKGFLLEVQEKKKRFYALTDKGHEYLSKYKIILEFTSSFGLDE